jgi:hypothetical protein
MKALIASIILLASTQPGAAQGFVVSGMMHHTTLEGGCWYLQADDGKHYELQGDSALIAPLRTEGEHASLRVVPIKGAASICMIGEIVKVLERTDVRRYPIDPLIMPMNLAGTMFVRSGKWYLKSKSGIYDFQNPPLTKYRHAGARYHQRVRVVVNTAATHGGTAGMIINEAPPKTKAPHARQQKPDDAR